MIRAKDVFKRYGNIAALNGVDLEVPRGSLYSLLGPNGAGKSTLIRILVGLIKQDRGYIEILGLDPHSRHSEVMSRVGYVPELPSFPDFMSGEEYLRLTADLYGLGRDSRTRISEVLSLVGLERASGRKIGTYSKGMIQRLAIAQAILPDPELLILDEPLMGIDPEARIQFKDLFVGLAKKGKTILYSSHVLEEVERISTHIAIINKGRIVASGTKEDVEAILKGDKEVEITLYEEIPGVSRLIEGVSGVKRVEAIGNRIKVYISGDGDDKIIRKRIYEVIRESGGYIIEMRLGRASIEDLFLRAIEKTS
ncbi:MAG: ABC transporter ATP-binding protein [Desulfurococcales archaeon]|nr:ABC transporter ATP-binding protein [Desulfurococcales archaeon]